MTTPTAGGIFTSEQIERATRIALRTLRHRKTLADDQARAAAAKRARDQQLAEQQRQVFEPEFFKELPTKYRRWSGVADFIENELAVLNPADELIPFKLRFLQRRIIAAELWARHQRRRPAFLILKYRKLGVTTVEQALAYWTTWAQPHRKCLTLAHKPDDTWVIFQAVVRFYQNHNALHRHRRTPARTTHLQFPDWDSIFAAITAAPGVGRGSTYARVHVSEAAHVTDLRGVHSGLVKSRGDTSAYVLESTANGRDGKGEAFYEFWQGAMKGQNEFIPLFYPWFADPENVLPLVTPDEIDFDLKNDDQAREMMQRFQLSKPQMKWWIKERGIIVADGRSGQVIFQEQPVDAESAFILSGTSYYDLDLLKACDRRCVDPIAVEQNGRLRIWELPTDTAEPASYIGGCDVSGGTGASDSVAWIANARTGEQAAVWQWNRMPADLFGEQVLPELGRRWANRVTGEPVYWIVENNNYGHQALTGLLRHANYPIERVYHRRDEAKISAENGNLPKISPEPGWRHGVKEHYDLTTAVGAMVREGWPKIKDRRTVESIKMVSSGPQGAEFTNRDLAIGAGLVALALPFAKPKSTKLYINGRLVDINEL